MTLFALWMTTFGFCVVGALVPFVNTEIYLITVAALSPKEFIFPLVLAATSGQVIGKIVMFYSGKGLLLIGNEKLRARVDAVRAKLEPRPWFAKATLFSSSLIGIPPLYVMSVACGTIGMGLAPFIVITTIGRLIHFAVVAMLPQYAKLLIG